MEGSDMDEARRLFRALPEAWVATADATGRPHVAPRWFVWTDEAFYASCDRASLTWQNLEADPRVSVSADLGRAWAELSGFTLEGEAELLAAENARMRGPISAWHEKYRNLLTGEGFERLTGGIERLGFIRIEGGEIRTWDHGS